MKIKPKNIQTILGALKDAERYRRGLASGDIRPPKGWSTTSLTPAQRAAELEHAEGCKKLARDILGKMDV